MKLSLYLILSVVFLFGLGQCFIPAKIVDFLIKTVDTKTESAFGKTNTTITHEEIVKRGLARSVAKFFYDQKNGTRIKLSKLNNEYLNFSNIYIDYYNKSICTPKVADLMKFELGPNVALVDLDPATKDMPYAHFDAEKFTESNTRVVNFTNKIFEFLGQKNYQKARALTAQILHTIQDFYSHSNWIEMGNTNKINTDIGTASFSSTLVVSPSENQTCFNNCTLIEAPCNSFSQLLVKFLRDINISAFNLGCPIKYYKCTGNLAKLDKLVSGYYTGQKLEDGTIVSKPTNYLKCSHGGLMDKDSFVLPSLGGINKDSGYYIFSPRADLHSIAANLAIEHTEYYFNQIRSRIGDSEYDKFLKLTYSQIELNKISVFATCSFNMLYPSFKIIFSLVSIKVLFQ